MAYCRHCGKQIADDARFCPSCGTATGSVAFGQQTAVAVYSTVSAESKFTGGAFANFFIGFLTGILSVLTIGLAYPALMCWKMRWRAKHTYVNGRRLYFDGTGMQLFGKYILWLLLSLITIGIYAIFAMPLNLKRWQSKHTHFTGVCGESKFDGSIWGLFGVNFVAGLVNIVTLFLGSFWSHCYRERWYARHEIVDGCRLQFNGTGMQYFGKRIVWLLLTVITIGIYSFWLVVNKEKWTALHTHAEDPTQIPEAVEGVGKETSPMSPDTKKSMIGMIVSLVGFVVITGNFISTIVRNDMPVGGMMPCVIFGGIGLLLNISSRKKTEKPIFSKIGILFSVLLLLLPFILMVLSFLEVI